MFRFAAPSILALSVTAAAPAAAWTICEINPAAYAATVASQIEGVWRAENPQGIMIASHGGDSVALPLPADAPNNVDVLVDGNQIAMASFEEGEEIILDVEVLPFSNIIDQVALALGNNETQAELSSLEGCDVAAYPAFMTELIIEDAGENTILTYRSEFRAMNADVMIGGIYGTIISPNGDLEVFRPFTMTRIDPQ